MKKGRPEKKGPVKKGPSPKNPVLLNLAGLALILGTGIIIYSNSFGCSWHLDDFINIVNNPIMRDLTDWETWWRMGNTRMAGLYSFALNYHFHEADVWGYHLVNLCIHLVNACLVWWLTFLICSSPALKEHKIASHKMLFAFVTALMFVLHPLATQSVTYIVQRLASQVAMFYFLSLAFYLQARLTKRGNLTRILLFAGCAVSAVLAMLTKENAFTLPFAIILSELFFIRTEKLSVIFRDYRVILLILLSLGALMVIPFQSSLSIFNSISPPGNPDFVLTPLNYFLTQFSVIVKYIQLLFLPVGQNLDYDFPVSHSLFEIKTLLSFLFLSSLVVLAVFLFKSSGSYRSAFSGSSSPYRSNRASFRSPM